MDIVWLGGSAVRVRSGDAVVVMDSDGGGSAGVYEGADIVTLSGGDVARGVVAEGARVLRGPGEYEIGDFYVVGTATAGVADGAGERRVNTAFTLRAEGVSVCHLGAIGGALTPRQAQEIGQPDVVVVEAGGDRLAVELAAQVVNQVSPRIVVPVRYAVDGAEDGGGLLPLARLLRELGVGDAGEGQGRLSVTATNLPRDMQVVGLREG